VSRGLTPARLVAWSGAAVVLLTVGSYAALAVQDRVALFVASYLACLAWSSAFLVYLAALHLLLRAREDETTALLAGVGLAGGLVNAAVIVLSVFLLALGESDASFLANNFTGFATAVCVGGFAPALRRVGFPSWLLVLGAAVGLHHLASAAAFATEGVFSPQGPISTTAPLGMTLWVGSVAALTWRRRERV
jgi:hypothetical protein